MNGSYNDALLDAERSRINAITQIAGGDLSLAAVAIRDGWSVDRTQQAVRGHGGFGAPAGIVRANPLANPKVLEAALCLRCGLPAAKVEADYGREIIDLAGSRAVRGAVSLVGLIQLTIQAAGGTPRYGPISDSTIRAAFEADRELSRGGVSLQAGSGFSTQSLTGILSNVAGKLLLASFEAVDMSILKACAQNDVANFKTVSRYRMTANGLFERVGPTGEIKSATATEETFTNKADTFARMMAVTRQDFINDDLGAFTKVTAVLGRNAALSLLRQIALRILNFPANWFSTANKNLFSGANTSLGINALSAGVQKFTELNDANGPLMITPKFLVVPATLSVQAGQLYSAAFVNETTTADAPKPNSNPHAGKYEPIMFPYLGANSGIRDDAGAVVTGSDTAWYLFANPMDVPAIEVVYLRGQRTPVIESAETDFSTLGMAFRGYFDFGTANLDPKGAQKQTGIV